MIAESGQAAPVTSLAVANSARQEADRQRAEWLVSLDAGVTDVADFFEFACTLEGRPLLRVPLRQVMLAGLGFSEAKTRRALDRIQQLLGVEKTTRNMTVAWLLDSRTGGKRFMAWLEATQILRSEPWSGFPYGSPFSALGGAQAAPARLGGAS